MKLQPYLDRVKAARIDCHCGSCSRKADEMPQGETVSEDDQFIDEELLLAAFLLLRFEQAVAAASVISKVMEAAETQESASVEITLNELDVPMSQVIDPVQDMGEPGTDDEDQARKILTDTLMTGLLLLGISTMEATRLLGGASGRLLYSLSDIIKYYGDNYFVRIAHPDILAAATRAGAMGDDLVAAMRKVLAASVEKTESYWRLVANQTTSRAHHYGMLKGMEERNIIGYRLVAVLDERTSALCRSLHGKEFYVADGISQLETVANTDPEDIAKVAPWVKAGDVIGKSSAELSAMGVMVPPFHPHCRTTLVPIY